jgi:hypothetical protein
VGWLLHFVTFDFVFKAITVTSVKHLGHPAVSYTLFINYAISVRPSSPNNLSTSTGTSTSPVVLLSLTSLIASSISLCKMLSGLIYFLFGFDIQDFSSISSIV